MEVEKCIKERRSVRQYLDKKIEWNKVAKILEAARHAPNAGNIQNWRFIVVDNKEKKENLAKAALNQSFLGEAGIIIVVCHIEKEIKRFYGKKAEVYSIQNTAAAVQNIMLRAFSLGLGSCWIGAFDEEAVKSELKVPNDVSIDAMVTLGYSKEKAKMPKRIDLKEIVYFEEWNNKVK